MIYKNIIFDFDGTLIDTSPGIIKAFSQVMRKYNMPLPTGNEIRSYIGIPLVNILRILLKTQDEELINEAAATFREIYLTDGIFINTIYPGILGLLQALRGDSRELLIVSNKPEKFILKILNQHNLNSYFSKVIGSSGTTDKGSKSDRLHRILDEFKLEPIETVIVGDAESDIEAAHANSIRCLAVSYGFRTNKQLKEAGAKTILADVKALQRILVWNAHSKSKTDS